MAAKKNNKLESIKRRRTNPGVYPGMGKKTSPFKDKSKEAKKKGCRGKPPIED